jgi:hypothetical protein
VEHFPGAIIDGTVREVTPAMVLFGVAVFSLITSRFGRAISSLLLLHLALTGKRMRRPIVELSRGKGNSEKQGDGISRRILLEQSFQRCDAYE